MCRLSDLLRQSLMDVHLVSQHQHQKDELILVRCLRWPRLRPASCGALISLPLCSLPWCNTLSIISHLSSAGHQVIHSFHWVVPSMFCDCVPFDCSSQQFSFLSCVSIESTQVLFFLLFFLDTRMGGVCHVCPWSASTNSYPEAHIISSLLT